jgi:hypothetical protein
MTDWLPNCFTWNAGCESLISSWTGGALCSAWTDAGCVAIKTSHPGLYTGLVVVAGGALVVATCVATCPAITIAAGGGGAALTTGGTVGSGATIAITVSSEVLAANAGLLTSYGLYMAADGSASGGGGSHSSSGQGGSSASKMQTEVQRGQAPRGVERVDRGNPNIPGNQDHAHITGQRATLNRDGTWGHGNDTGTLTSAQRDWFRSHGWNV